MTSRAMSAINASNGRRVRNMRLTLGVADVDAATRLGRIGTAFPRRPRCHYGRSMFAAYVTTPNPDQPLAALEVGDRPEPEVPAGWTTVQVKAASLNHHDLFSLQGVGLPPTDAR